MVTLLFLKLIFRHFPIMNNSGKVKEISWTSFYCIIPLEVQFIREYLHNKIIYILGFSEVREVGVREY